MKQKMIGAILLVASVVIAAFLLIDGKPIIPHMIGPTTLAVVGVVVLTFKERNSRPAE